MVKSVLIFVGQELSMVKCVPTNAIQATHVLGLVQTGVAMASGHKADFTARIVKHLHLVKPVHLHKVFSRMRGKP